MSPPWICQPCAPRTSALPRTAIGTIGMPASVASTKPPFLNGSSVPSPGPRVPSGKMMTESPRRIFSVAARRLRHGLRVVAAVDDDVVGVAQRPAEDGNARELLLGDPAQLELGQRRDHREDVEMALVVGHEDEWARAGRAAPRAGSRMRTPREQQIDAHPELRRPGRPSVRRRRRRRRTSGASEHRVERDAEQLEDRDSNHWTSPAADANLRRPGRSSGDDSGPRRGKSTRRCSRSPHGCDAKHVGATIASIALTAPDAATIVPPRRARRCR